MPRVSVIMGVYNSKNFDLLEKSVYSILNQTFADFEFIICDDGSTNGSLEQILRLAEKDERIKVLFYEENKGLNYALNFCLKHAVGELIARQDDDDISDENRLSEEIKFLDDNPQYSFVGTNASIFDDNGEWGNYINPEKPRKIDFYWNSPFIHPSIVMRKNAIDSVGGYRIAKETRRCEDIDLFMRMYAKGYIGYNIQKKLYSYRMVNDPKIKYRKMKYRIDEAVVKYKGYKEMGVLFRGLPYVLKPILVGLIPQKLLYKIKKKRY